MKVRTLEDELKKCLPEKLSRSQLLKRAIQKAQNSKADWDRAYSVLRQAASAHNEVAGPEYLQARLDAQSEAALAQIKEEIRVDREMERVTNVFAWQMVLANLLTLERDREGMYPETIPPSTVRDLPITAQADAVKLMARLIDLLEIERPTDADYAALSKISKILSEWEAANAK